MKKLILPELPENLAINCKEEERIRTEALLNLNSSEDQRDHVEMFQKSLNMLHDLTIEYHHQKDDELTIQNLGIRLFNDSVTSFKLLTAGYYQAAYSIQRDILEIIFLLDYFSAFPAKINEWKNATNDELLRNFRPVAIRDELDKRDGFQEKKRASHYKLFCEYASHPSFIGIIKLTTPSGTNRNRIGAFFDEKLLRNCFFELVKLIESAVVIYLSFFDLPSKASLGKLEFLKHAQNWFDKYKVNI